MSAVSDYVQICISQVAQSIMCVDVLYEYQ